MKKNVFGFNSNIREILEFVLTVTKVNTQNLDFKFLINPFLLEIISFSISPTKKNNLSCLENSLAQKITKKKNKPDSDNIHNEKMKQCSK